MNRKIVKPRLLFVVIIVSIVIGYACFKCISLELKPLSNFPFDQEEGIVGGEKTHYWYPIRISIPAKIPFTIENIEIKNTDGHTIEDSVLIYVYDSEGKSPKGGAGYVTEEWIWQTYPSLMIPEGKSLYTKDAYVFLLFPSKYLESISYELILRYSWFGLIKKESTSIIE